MLGNPGSYANKKRKKPVLKQKKINGATEVVKTNPSKRHRDRLNGELDRLTDLLPFPDDVRSRLDKLSVLRLSVGYLRVKSYFKATMKSSKSSSLMFPGVNGQNGNKTDIGGFSEGDILLQALNGFVMVVTSDGSVFYTSDTIKEYLGFQQSDVVHQSVFDLIHTDDRATFRQQLHFALNPPSVGEGDVVPSNGTTVMYNPEQLPPENSSFLERSFVCRFRCLLDNSSGFLALKFQGRLKYLHGQRVLRDNGTCNKSQLALFTIATPVQPPAIVEIRAKMLLFQTKHKLDFTPMGVDSRGKLILGYSETELCMKGSGYQFIHAADMMYCADSHLRMMKTGETGLTVFRLLSKSGGWVWVKSNAKIIFKGGRPEFIIAYQRALVNAEGEEFLRQRQLQLPFSFTTGEAMLYNTGPTVDLKQFQMDKMFGVDNSQADVSPGSLLDCFLKQDESIYTRTIDPPVPADQVFMDTHALVSIGSDTWQDSGSTTTTGESVVVKEEAKQSVMAVIDNMEKMAQNGDFSTALQNLDVGSEELMEWESALKRLSQGDSQQNDVRSELDSVLTNDIFDYIDSVLFKEKGEDCLDASPSACLTTVNNNNNTINQQAVNGQLFNTPSPDCTYSPTNGLYAHQPNTMNGAVITGQSLAQSAPNPIFNSTQKLSHRGPLVTDIMPPLQQLQLQDIFTPSIELPELTIPDAPAAFQSCRQQQASLNQMAMLGQTQSNQQLLMQCPQNGVQAPVNGLFLQSSVKQPNSVVAPIQGVMDILPPLIPCNDFKSCSPPNIPIPFATACLQGTPASLESQQQVQQWPQKLPNTAGLIQNGHELMLASHSQNIDGQIYPLAFPGSAVTTNGLNHAQQGRLACGQAANQYMYNQQHFSSPSAPQGGHVLAFNGTLGHTSLDQSPPQGSCYFQWSRSEPIVGSSVINQENANISPISMPNNMAAPSSSSSSSAEHAVNMQRYLECHRQSHVNMSHCGLDPFTQQQ